MIARITSLFDQLRFKRGVPAQSDGQGPLWNASHARYEPATLVTAGQLATAVGAIDMSAKADKVTGATNGHLAGLDAAGNLTDSGYSASSFDAAGAASAVGLALLSHAADHSNPHAVTAAQTGAYSTAQTDGAINTSIGALTLNGITGTLGVTKGGTGLATIASGKLFYASANDTLAPLTLGTGLSITTGTLNAAATSPGGSSGQLQYNNSGAFGGIAAANNAVLVTDGSGVGAWGTSLPAVSGASLTGLTKSQVGLGSVENTGLSTWAGSTNLTTLGTVTTAGNVALLNAANTFTHTSGQTFAGPLACTSTSSSSLAGPLTAAGVTTITVDDATSNSFTDVLKLVHTNSGGNGVNGIGAGLLFRSENGGGTVTDAARISGGLDGAGAGSEQGILRFFVRKSGALAEYARLSTDGALALGGAFSPSGSNTVLDIRYVSAELRFRNTGDPGGASWAANQNAIWLGLYNPSGSTWGIVPSGVTRGIFAYDNNGVIGSLVPAAIGASSPSWRNKLDDGSGNSSFAGTLSVDSTIASKSYTVATLPTPGTARRIAYASNARNAGEGSGAGTGSSVVDDGTVWKIPGIAGAVSA